MGLTMYNTLSRSPKRKRKRKSEPVMDAVTRDILDRLVRIKTRERLKDPDGNIREFRSTIAENQVEEEEIP